MVTSSHLDADAEIVARIRAGVGRGFPLAVTFDLHGNLSERVPDLCDIVIAYRTNPHIDQRQRGRQTAQLLFRWVHGEIRPRLALAKPPFLINIMKQDTSCPPLQHWMQRIDQLEQEPGILSASLLPGFAYADVPQIGPSVLVVSDGDVGLAQKRADDLAHQLWEDREAFQVALPNAAAAVQMALAEEHLPVVLVDTGDNVGGGSAGDGTVLLAELLRQHATKFVVCLYAPDEVRRCASSGIAAEVALRVGGKVDRLHGDPVEIAGIVRLLHDGTYEETAVRHGGKRLNHMGQTAVVELPGESLLVLTTYRHPPFSLGALTCLGICPSVMRILVVKAAIAYKSAYGPIAGSIIEVATPGLTVIDPQALPYRHRRRPLWPLDQG
jgi:microcystin degradation protein MlrC